MGLKRMNHHSENRGNHYRRSYAQYAAILVFIGLTVLLCVSARYGIQNDDETACVAIAHRILFHDLPFQKNWSTIELHAFIEYLPFRLLYAALGGTEGIVLGIRYIYVAIKMLFYGAICIFFRRYRYWAILCAVVFTAFHPIDFMSLTYYNVSILCAFAVGCFLFITEKRTTAVQIAAGIVFAFCVLANPPTILVYVGYTAFVLFFSIKNRHSAKSDDAVLSLFSFRFWGSFTEGAAFVAGIVCLTTFCTANKETLLQDAFGVFRTLQVSPQVGNWEKYSLYFSQTGLAPNIAAIGLLLLIATLAVLNKLHQVRSPIFIAACLVYIWMTAEQFFRGGILLSSAYLSVFKPIPLCFLGLASYLLSSEKNKKLFAFYVFGLTCSVCIDLFSKSTVLTGGIVSAPASILLFRQALVESGEMMKKDLPVTVENGAAKEKTAHSKSVVSLLKFSLILTLSVMVVSESAYCFYARFFPQLETVQRYYVRFDPSPENVAMATTYVRLERGPLKGIETAPNFGEKYEAILKDMDQLKLESPTSLFVMNYCYFGNLYLDLPYACFNSDRFTSAESRKCLLDYWTLHPDAKPDFIYVPFFSCEDFTEDLHTEEKLTFLRSICDCEIQTGEAGYFLKVLSWK